MGTPSVHLRAGHAASAAAGRVCPPAIRVGDDRETGKAKSAQFNLPDGTKKVRVMRSGGADANSGFVLKKVDGSSLCKARTLP